MISTMLTLPQFVAGWISNPPKMAADFYRHPPKIPGQLLRSQKAEVWLKPHAARACDDTGKPLVYLNRKYIFIRD